MGSPGKAKPLTAAQEPDAEALHSARFAQAQAAPPAQAAQPQVEHWQAANAQAAQEQIAHASAAQTPRSARPPALQSVQHQPPPAAMKPGMHLHALGQFQGVNGAAQQPTVAGLSAKPVVQSLVHLQRQPPKQTSAQSSAGHPQLMSGSTNQLLLHVVQHLVPQRVPAHGQAQVSSHLPAQLPGQLLMQTADQLLAQRPALLLGGPQAEPQARLKGALHQPAPNAVRDQVQTHEQTAGQTTGENHTHFQRQLAGQRHAQMYGQTAAAVHLQPHGQTAGQMHAQIHGQTAGQAHAQTPGQTVVQAEAQNAVQPLPQTHTQTPVQSPVRTSPRLQALGRKAHFSAAKQPPPFDRADSPSQAQAELPMQVCAA